MQLSRSRLSNCFLPGKAVLSELAPGVLEPEVLPCLWDGGVATLAEIETYFQVATL